MRPCKAYLILLARTSLRKLLLLAAVTAAVEAGLFWFAMERALARGSYSLAEVVDASRIDLAVLAAVAAACVLLCFAGREQGMTVGYLPQSHTLRRLDLSFRARYFTQGAYKTACLLALWAAQVAILWGLCALYTLRVQPDAASHQTVLLAFLHSRLLQSLFPMGAPLLWLCNLTLTALLALDAAFLSLRFRYPLLPIYSSLWSAIRELASDSVILLLLLGLLLVSVLRGARKEVTDEFIRPKSP